MRCFSTNQRAIVSPCGQFIALVHQARLLIRSSIDDSNLRSIRLHPELSGKYRVHWQSQNKSSQATEEVEDKRTESQSLRILVANDDTIHLYDILDPKWHAVISGASRNTGKIAYIDLRQNEVLVYSDFSLAATLWSLHTGRGAEIRDPKGFTYGYGFSPSSEHLAILTRPTTHDLVMILAAETRELVSSFTVPTVDAQGLKWSPNGQWLAVWETSSAGFMLFIHTQQGQLFRTYAGGQDTDRPGLGIREIEWDRGGKWLAIGAHSDQIKLLSTDKFQLIATLVQSTQIDSSDTTVWQEQIDSSGCRTYSRAATPASPPTEEAKENSCISHLVFNARGTLLASLSRSTPTTVWIWSIDTLSLVAVLIHHGSIRGLQWHHENEGLLMIHCTTQDPVIHIWNSDSYSVPTIRKMPLEKLGGKTEAGWLCDAPKDKPRIILLNAQNYAVQYAFEKDETSDLPSVAQMVGLEREDMFDEGNSMDLSPIKLDHDFARNIIDKSPENGSEAQWHMSDDVDDTFDYRRRLHVGV